MNSRGFSLYEPLLIIFLVSVPILSLVATEMFAYRASAEARERHAASLVASSLVEEAERELFTDFSRDLDRALTAVPSFPRHAYEMTVDPADQGVRQLQVKVFWTDAQGGLSHYQLDTYLAKP